MDFDAPAPSDDRLPAGTRIGRAALRVADLDETTAFYRDVVGLAVPRPRRRPSDPRCRRTILLVLDRDPDRPERVGPTPASFTPRSAFPHAPRSARGWPVCESGGGSTALPTTSSARRCTSTIPKATAWRSTATAPARGPRRRRRDGADGDRTARHRGRLRGGGSETPTATSSTASRPAPTWVTCISKSPRCRRSRRCTSTTASASRSGWTGPAERPVRRGRRLPPPPRRANTWQGRTTPAAGARARVVRGGRPRRGRLGSGARTARRGRGRRRCRVRR